jgi:hypothetical protein
MRGLIHCFFALGILFIIYYSSFLMLFRFIELALFVIIDLPLTNAHKLQLALQAK